MDLDQPWPLLGGMTPRQFMRRHWQRRPLLVRQAWPAVEPPVSRQQLFELAASRDVESRLVTRDPATPGSWQLRRGPLRRRSLPALARPAWSLLVQGVDLHVERAHAMLSAFRFVPDARLDDLMVSWASDGGGVGPHLDSYDVFLLQVQGRRRWRVGPVRQPAFVEGLPLRILRDFHPEQEWVLDPGDLLYLPPRWGHDGIAIGECMTCSIGFRAPSRASLAGELLARIAEDEDAADPLYRDAGQQATGEPARIPAALQAFAREAVRARLRRDDTLMRALGEVLTEPKPQVWFDERSSAVPDRGVRLDRRTRMMYDDRHLFVNGESFRVGGRDARVLAHLADARMLSATQVARLGDAARGELAAWIAQGWVHPLAEDDR
jgi:50S ribosomal protein L16 3-hydroxylase